MLIQISLNEFLDWLFPLGNFVHHEKHFFDYRSFCHKKHLWFVSHDHKNWHPTLQTLQKNMKNPNWTCIEKCSIRYDVLFSSLTLPLKMQVISVISIGSLEGRPFRMSIENESNLCHWTGMCTTVYLSGHHIWFKSIISKGFICNGRSFFRSWQIYRCQVWLFFFLSLSLRIYLIPSQCFDTLLVFTL